MTGGWGEQLIWIVNKYYIKYIFETYLAKIIKKLTQLWQAMRWINYQQRLRGTWCSVNLNVDQCLLRIDILQNIHISFLVASSFQCWQRIINVLFVTLQARRLSWKTHWCPPHHMKYKWADTLIGQFSSQRKICMMTPNKDMLKIERFSFLMFSNITYKNCSQHIQMCLPQIDFPLFFKSWKKI